MRIATAGLFLVAAVVAACSGGAATAAPPTAAPATGGPTVAPGTPGAPATRIEVTLNDSLRIEPAEMRVPAGVPITFVVTNTGVLEHELYLGDAAAQDEHEREMAGGAMIHDEPGGVGVPPGKTKELVYTFPASGSFLAGCHVQGHYLAGMKASITVE